jgi:hypothetical protein
MCRSSDFYTSDFDPVSEHMIKQPDLSSLIEDTSASAPVQKEGTLAAPPFSAKNGATDEVESLMHRPLTTLTESPAWKRSKDEIADSDLLLAMQLQEEERQEAHREEEQAGTSNRNQPQPQSIPNPSVRPSQTVPALATGGNVAVPAGNNDNLPLSQEELDQQYALMLHYQEINAQQQPPQGGGSRRTTPQNARYDPQQSYPTSSRNSNQNTPPVQTGRGGSNNSGGNCLIQ